MPTSSQTPRPLLAATLLWSAACSAQAPAPADPPAATGDPAAPTVPGEPDPAPVSDRQPATAQGDRSSATPDRPGPDQLAASLALCKPLAGKITDPAHQASHLGRHGGVDVIEVTTGRDRTVVAVGDLRGRGQPGCSVQRPDAALAPLAGRFWPDAAPPQPVDAVAMGPRACTGESCPVTVVVRRDDRALAGVYLPGACDRGVRLSTLSWFPGQDSIQVTCHRSAGAARREYLTVVHATGRGLRPIWTMSTGVYEQASQDERADPDFCPRRPVGAIDLVTGGPRPVIRVLDPSRGEPGRDGAGVALRSDWQYDPEAASFRELPGATRVPYDARDCASGSR